MVLVLEHAERHMDAESWALVNALRAVSSGRRAGRALLPVAVAGQAAEAASAAAAVKRPALARQSPGLGGGGGRGTGFSTFDTRPYSVGSGAGALASSAGSVEALVTEFAAPGARPLLVLVTRPLTGRLACAEYEEALAESRAAGTLVTVGALDRSDAAAFLRRAVALKVCSPRSGPGKEKAAAAAETTREIVTVVSPLISIRGFVRPPK